MSDKTPGAGPLLQPDELPQHVGQAANRDRRQAWARDAVARLWQFAAEHRDASREDLGVALGLAGADIVTGPDIDTGDELPAALALLAAAVLGSVPMPDGRPWRFDVPEVPPGVTAFEDDDGDVYLRLSDDTWALADWDPVYIATCERNAKERPGRGGYRLVDLLQGVPLVECPDPRKDPT